LVSDGVYSTVQIASRLGVDYEIALEWAAEQGLPRLGRAFVWRTEDAELFAQMLDDDLEGDDEDDDDEDEDEDDEDDE
jgi:hypothetical protein